MWRNKFWESVGLVCRYKCVRVNSETVDTVGDRSVLFVESLNTIGFVCDYLDKWQIENAFEQEIDFKDAADCPMDTGCACGELLTALLELYET